MKRLFLLSLAIIALCVSQMSAQPKRELRSTWLTTVWSIDWPSSTNQASAKAQLIEYLDALEGHNFTGVCFQVRGLADALYKSSYEPWSAAVGSRGKDPGWDPLAYAVDECHKRGLECYAWVNPYRIRSSEVTYSTSYDKQWKNNGWELDNGEIVVFNPGLAECRAHILKVIKEIYSNYAIDGMLFDDYFYPSGGMSEESDAPDYELYESSGTSLSIGDWRRKNVNDFMKEIYDNIQQDRPDMRFGISPAGVAGASASKYGLSKPSIKSTDWQYAQIYSDPLAWMNNKALDFISPQIYWTTDHSTAPFGPLTKWWSNAADKFGCHFYASHSISFLYGSNTSSNWEEVADQVTAHRNGCVNNEPGEIYYSARNIDGIKSGYAAGLGDHLEQNLYTRKSLVPVVDWKEHPTYGAPSSLTQTSTTLKWAATTGEGQAIIRYSVYAIPTSVSIENAQASDGDGIDGKYLLGVSYNTTYTIPSDKRSGYYYAVCVYDGYGYEYAPALAGYDVEPSKATTLISPKGGETVEWNTTFKWNIVSGATYAVEIASDVNFSDVQISVGSIKTNSTSINLEKLKGDKTYFWRVITTEPEKMGTASTAETFTTPVRPVGDYEAGYSIQTDPDSYATGDFNLTSLWMRSTKDGFNNFTTAENGSFNRGMVATKNYVYLAGRDANSASATIFLEAYNAQNGEHEFDLILSTDGQGAYYPCNDVMKDSKGNVCISNLTLNLSNNPLRIHLVDLATGNLTEVASLSASSGRVDHADVYGDVASGNFTVFAAASGSNTVYRWKVTNGYAGDAESMTIKERYPSSASNIGIAPRVTPVSENLVYVDGGTTATALYDFSTGKIVDKPSDSWHPANADYEANGQARFFFANTYFVVYAAGDDASGFNHNIVCSSTDKVLSEGKLLWTAPKNTLGAAYSGNMSAPADAVIISDTEARIYTYSSGNGIAAYTLTKVNTGITDIEDDNCSMTIYSNVVTFAEKQEFIKAYNTAGILIESVTDSDELALPGAGSYIIVTPSSAQKVAIN